MANGEVTTANSSLEFEPTLYSGGCCQAIDDNHFINFFAGTDSDWFAQVFTVNTTTGAVTTAAASLEFDGVSGLNSNCLAIDANHFVNFWTGTDLDGFSQVFTVNTSTGAVTTAGSQLEFDTTNASTSSVCSIDTNHCILFWVGENSDGYTQVFEVDTDTGAVTTSASWLEFDTDKCQYPSCCQIDDNHFINFWGSTGDNGLAQVFAVNTTTGAVTTAGSQLEFDTQNSYYNTCCKIDDNHFINCWAGGSSISGFAQVFTVNTSTGAVTTANSALAFDTNALTGRYNSVVQIDDNHFINFFAGAGYDGYVQVFEVNTSTGAVTTAAASLEFDTTLGEHNTCCQIDTSHYINFGRGADYDGFVQTFEVTVPAADTDSGFFLFFN